METANKLTDFQISEIDIKVSIDSKLIQSFLNLNKNIQNVKVITIVGSSRKGSLDF